MGFNQRLAERCDVAGHLCVGLDPDAEKYMPLTEQFGWRPGISEYCRFVIDATAGVAAALKVNAAFFERYGADGVRELELTIQACHERANAPLVILDAKRGDIGNSSKGYADAAFKHFRADAVTISPYMGWESVSPFLADPDRGAFVLCRTSNKGSAVFQEHGEHGSPLFLRVAAEVCNEWNANDNCGLVVGATYPKDVPSVIGVAAGIPLLIPGVGEQGGDLKSTVRALSSSRAYLINSSRAIMYPDGQYDDRDSLAQAIRNQAEATASDITNAKLAP